MSSARMVRSAKSRFFITVLLALVFCALTYLFHNSQNEVDSLKSSIATCAQQQESLSAQLQVIFEYKLRLEKSLQKEKAEHKETKDECDTKAQEEKLLREKDSYEASNKYNALSQHYKLLQSSNKDLNEECDKIRKTQLESADEIVKLENKLQSLVQELKQVQEAKNKSLETMKVQYEELQKENERLSKENARLKGDSSLTATKMELVQLESDLDKTKTALEQCRAGSGPIKQYQQPDAQAAPSAATANKPAIPPLKDEDIGVGIQVTGSSTTPQINPEAVMDHDGPLKLAHKDVINNKTSTPTFALAGNKPTSEDVAAPLVVPDQPFGLVLPQPYSDSAHQFGPPENVQHKPDNMPAGDLVKQPGDLFVPAADIHREHISNENNKADAAHVPQDMNGAIEELEDGQRDNEIPRQAKHHEYQGGDYDKEEDDEGEQMDYMVGGGEPKHQPPRPQPLNRQMVGGSVMVNPK